MSWTSRATFALLLLATLLPRAARAADTKVAAAAHLVTLAPSGARVLAAQPAEPPSGAHPEGTVYAIVETAPSVPNVMELDVATGTELHRASLECQQILRSGGLLFAACGDDIVELDRTLLVAARMQTRGCPSGQQRASVKLVHDGGARLVSVFTCDERLQLAVVDPREHRALGNVRTDLFTFPRSRSYTTIFFHGSTLGGYVPGPPLGPNQVFVLSPELGRVAHTLTHSNGERFEDDGTHVHLSLERDVTLTDALAPLSSAPLREHPSEPHPPLPAGIGGDGVLSTFTQGDVRFFLTFSCCGSGERGGLYAAKVSASTGASAFAPRL